MIHSLAILITQATVALLFALRKRDRIVQQRFNEFILNLTLDVELKARERQETPLAG